MALISMPSSVYFEGVDSLKLQRGGLTMRSRYTGKRQAVTFPFAMWVFDGTVIPVDGTDAGEWRAFLTGLEGVSNTFQMKVPGTDGGPLSGYNSNASQIVNGTFTTDASGWTAAGGATIASVGGQLQITNDSTGTHQGSAYQAINTVPGMQYTIKWDNILGTGSYGIAGAGTAPAFANLGNLAGAGIGRTLTFTATTAVTYICLFAGGVSASTYVLFDNVTVTGYWPVLVASAGAAIRATSLPITAAPSTLVLKKGDYFTVNDELKVAQADVTTDATGAATVTFEPFLRAAVASGVAVNVAAPYVVLAAADPNQAGWGLSQPVVHKIRLQAAEAF